MGEYFLFFRDFLVQEQGGRWAPHVSRNLVMTESNMTDGPYVN